MSVIDTFVAYDIPQHRSIIPNKLITFFIDNYLKIILLSNKYSHVFNMKTKTNKI